MNKKADSWEYIIKGALVLLVVLVLLFGLRGISYAKEFATSLGEKAKGFIGPTTPTDIIEQNYLPILLEDNPDTQIKQIDARVEKFSKGGFEVYFGAGVKTFADYSALERSKKVEGFYNKAKGYATDEQNKLKETGTDEWIKFSEMKMKLDFAHVYATSRYTYYSSLPQPTAKLNYKNVLTDAELAAAEKTANDNCIQLKTLKPIIGGMKVPPDFKDIADKVNLLNATLGNIDKDCCSVGSEICESKMKYLCRWGKYLIDDTAIVGDAKCVKDECKTMPDESSCKNNPKCFTVYFILKSYAGDTINFHGCRDCKDVNCNQYNDIYSPTCNEIATKCGKCSIVKDSEGKFKECVN